MILYHAEPNLYSLKPLIALEEKGARYERRRIANEPVERAVPGYPAETVHKINVERDGPVLVDGGEMIAASFFMLEYIAEAVPGPALLPDDALGRYKAQSIGQIVAGTVAPFVTLLGLAKYPLPAGDYADVAPSERRAAWEAASAPGDASALPDKLRPTLAKLEAMLEGPWFCGSYSIADIDVFAMIRTLPDIAPGLLSDGLGRFVARMEARPPVRRALAAGWGADPAETYLPGPEISRWG